jgi:acyl-CoA synthetase (AMP-forming)/AMP-acid ligase II
MDTAHHSGMTLAALFAKRAQAQPQAAALTDGRTTLSYGALAARVARLAGGLQALRLQRGDRIALWSENRIEVIELELAAAQLGVIVACLNWRLSEAEQRHCISLVAPAMMVVSPRYEDALRQIDLAGVPKLVFDADYQRLCTESTPASHQAQAAVEAEDGFVILYTSGTTGLPKGALISQRAIVARAMVFTADYGIRGDDSFIAWSPLFHMAANDHAMATLLLGGQVIVCDGLDLDRICHWLATERIGWLLAMPGMIEGLIAALKGRPALPRPVRLVGAMADLVPHQQIAELSALVGAPYLNSFGSTETGLPPASAGLLAPGALPTSLSKRESSWCLTRLLDADGREVPAETPGEMAVCGPTLFSGYWARGGIGAQDLRDGWFHMGDVFVRHADGSLDFVDRLKYLIKSGGENIYPAEIERVLLAHPTVRDVAVVRKRDARWGEVPVAFVACAPESFDAAALQEFCRAHLAGYKVPKEFLRIDVQALPRSSTGKVLRHELEKQV